MLARGKGQYLENFLIHQECNGTPDLVFCSMDFKIVVLERDLCSEVGGYLDHERLDGLVGKGGWWEKDVILDGQQPETNPVISTRLPQPSQSHVDVQMRCGAYQLHYRTDGP